MYHMCLARIFEPLQSGMTIPEVVRCPDGHLRRAIYTLGPYIADYPEQVWLAGIVQGWCPKYVSNSWCTLGCLRANWLLRCEAKPDDLDGNFGETCRRKHERTDFIIKCFDPGTVWEKYGIRSDIVVSIYNLEHLSTQANQALSHLHMDFRALISTHFYHLISFISSLKVPSRITWWRGWTTISTSNTARLKHLKSYMTLTDGL